MWVRSMALEYINHIMWFPNKVRMFFTVHTFRLTLGNVGGVVLSALLTGIIVHADIIHKIHTINIITIHYL